MELNQSGLSIIANTTNLLIQGLNPHEPLIISNSMQAHQENELVFFKGEKKVGVEIKDKEDGMV